MSETDEYVKHLEKRNLELEDEARAAKLDAANWKALYEQYVGAGDEPAPSMLNDITRATGTGAQGEADAIDSLTRVTESQDAPRIDTTSGPPIPDFWEPYRAQLDKEWHDNHD